MAMTKEQKVQAVEEISEKLATHPTIYLTDYSGLSVAQTNELRGRFRKAGIEFKVLKNTLVRLAMERKGGYEEIYEQLNGPTALAFCEEPAAPARTLRQFLTDKKLTSPQLKAAYIDGAVYFSESLDVLAALKSKDELLGDILGLVLSPMSNVIGGLQAQGQNLVGVLQTIAEKEG
jgi:large subunit ribosomal protein L10